MDTLSTIKLPILKELEVLNNVLRETLATSNSLLNTVIDHYLETKGKQMRPILVLLAAKLVGEINQTTIGAAVSIELLHNASLIHDDVVDESLQRRGHDSVNAIWDNKIAVLVGDFFVSSALKSSLKTKNTDILTILSVLGQELATGEIDQLTNAKERSLSESAYFNVIRLKTASLFSSCMKAGAVSTGASPADLERLTAFGEKLGICFQIKDDIFDFSDNSDIGKPTGNDIREGKITLPLIYALNNGGGEEHERMLKLLKKESFSQTDINDLINYARNNGGITYATTVMTAIQDEAMEIINYFPDSPVIKALKNILRYTTERNK